MPKPLVALIALACFAAPILLTLVSYETGGSHQENLRPGQLPGEVLYFTAPWCGACRAAAPAYEELRGAGYPIRKINVDSNPSLAQQYGIRSIPQFVYIKDGREVRRVGGVASAERIKKLYRGGW